jgi:uncharacterized lipoprotein YajG
MKGRIIMKNIFTMALLLSLGACATQRVHFTNKMSLANMPSYEKSQSFFLRGIGQSTDVNAAEVCGAGKVLRVDTSYSGLDVILDILTFGIYSPRTVAIYCKK